MYSWCDICKDFNDEINVGVDTPRSIHVESNLIVATVAGVDMGIDHQLSISLSTLVIKPNSSIYKAHRVNSNIIVGQTVSQFHILSLSEAFSRRIRT